jgi:cation/acetate symporter
MSIAVICFLVTVGVTLLITFWAARKGSDRASMYAAGGKVTGGQNGLAIAGDFMSATTVLGVVGLYFGGGVDTMIYFITPLAAMCLILLWTAGPLRRLGRFTLGDVLVARLKDPKMRVFSGVSTIVISLIYLIAQLVGAGALVSVLFGLTFNVAVMIVGALMAIYITFGGMLAATWVQIIKAMLLIAGVALLSVLAIQHAGGTTQLFDQAAAVHKLGERLFHFGGMKLDLFNALSLGAGLTLGVLGLPHLLIRFFTVPDEAAARRSMVTACVIIGVVFIMTFAIIGPAAAAFVTGNPDFVTPAGAVKGGPNMVVIHLAKVVGGEVLMGAFSAVAFATILAVVAGLTIAIASATSHDVFHSTKPEAERSETGELWLFRLAAVVASVAAVALAIIFQKENVAYLVALAMTVSGSTNFPVIILSLYWPRFTSTGALVGGLVGLVSSVTFIILSPGVWVRVLHHPAPIFPADYPALASAPLAFVVCWLVSLMTQPKPVVAGMTTYDPGATGAPVSPPSSGTGQRPTTGTR